MSKLFLALFLASLAVIGMHAQTSDSGSARWYFDEGIRLMTNKSFDQALDAFEKSASLDPKQPGTFANIGTASLLLKRYEKGEVAFRTAIKLAPADGSFHTSLCQALSLQKKHAEAIASCDEGIKLSPTSDRAQLARLVVLQTAGRSAAELRNAVDTAVAKFRTSEVILAFAADFNALAGNYSDAAILLQSLVNMRPETASYRGALAEAYLYLGRDVDSLASARTALRLEPLNPFANYAMGLIFYELGQHEEAADSFSKAGSDDPRLKYAHYYLAMSESRRGKSSKAIAILRELTAKYPSEFEFHRQLGSLLSQADMPVDAETVYARANELRSGDVDVLVGLAMARMSQAKFETAIPLFEEAVRQKPNNEFYKMFLNVARARQGIPPQIPAMVREAEAKPKDVKIRIALAQALAFINRIDEAEKYIKELYALDPEDDQIYHVLGVALSEAGKRDQALEAFKKSLVKKENPAAYLGMAGIYSERSEFDLASAAYAKVIELKPDSPNIIMAYAHLLRDNGKRREALEMYKRSLSLLPNNGLALFNAGLLSLKLGDRESATNYLGVLQTIDPQLGTRLARCLALKIWG
ncbi:MAG: tetratricopeptide repeat protein [Acidobacteria bacterium]|nr:tetratricopeptide repeat protein [Acidobacteriota bacterium]